MDTQEWTRTIKDRDYVVSTSRALLPVQFVQRVLDDPDVYWSNSTSEETTTTMIENSCVLGLYQKQQDVAPGSGLVPIGMARLITDSVSFAFLTDVFLLKEYRGLGLGIWLIDCVRKVTLRIPHLRWLMLLTGSEEAQRLYRREFGMSLMEEQPHLVAMGARKAALQAVESSKSNLSQGQNPTEETGTAG
jgi:GNAT superfamily N-acetyltransferase